MYKKLKIRFRLSRLLQMNISREGLDYSRSYWMHNTQLETFLRCNRSTGGWWGAGCTDSGGSQGWTKSWPPHSASAPGTSRMPGPPPGRSRQDSKYTSNIECFPAKSIVRSSGETRERYLFWYSDFSRCKGWREFWYLVEDDWRSHQKWDNPDKDV